VPFIQIDLPENGIEIKNYTH